MGDDAEYYAEQLKLENGHHPTAHGLKRVVTWIDGAEEEVWSWHPGRRMNGWFERIHKEFGVGNHQFLATRIERRKSVGTGGFKRVGKFAYSVTEDADEALFDVIVIPRAHLPALEAVARKLKSTPGSLIDSFFAGMCTELAAFLRRESKLQEGIFVRDI